MEKLELYTPLKNGTITQPFGANANGSYESQGLNGHTGIDIASFYGDIEMAACSGTIYKTINFDNPNLGFYRAVFTIVETDSGIYEVSYGHCKSFLSTLGISVNPGDPIATEGNTGQVYAGGIEVTTAAKQSGSQAGTHLHFQVRAVQKTTEIDVHAAANGEYLTMPDGNFYKMSDGSFLRAIDYNNGYNGCIDPKPFMNNIPASSADTAVAIVHQSSEVIKTIATSNITANKKDEFIQWIESAIMELFKGHII